MSDVRVRRAAAPDAARLAMLGGATFLVAFAHDHPGEALVDHIGAHHSQAWYADALADADRAIWIAETALGAPIGYAVLAPPKIAHPTGDDDLELMRLYVLPGWQGAALGVGLLRAVEREARDRGARRLVLCVYHANPRAQAFYAREGFVDTGSRQTFMVGAVPFDDQIWEKRLVQ